MILAALRDLQWRRKRFAIAAVATALVFAMSLVMSGLSESFPSEISRFLDVLNGQSYLAASGEAGPFTSTTVVATENAPEDAPMLFWSATVPDGDTVRQAALVGLPIGWSMPVANGRQIRQDGEALVDSSLGLDVGGTLVLGERRFRVVGTTSNLTLFGGQPLVILTITDAQTSLAAGAQITRAFVSPVAPDQPAPTGLARFSRDETAEDLLRPIGNAGDAIIFVKLLLWLVAICIVGSVVFLSALERGRDFAVFKATGVKSWQMGMGLAVQAVVLTLLASLVSIGLAFLLAPLFPMPVAIPTDAAVTLPIVAVGVGLLASLAGLRRTVTADPAQAFGGQ